MHSRHPDIQGHFIRPDAVVGDDDGDDGADDDTADDDGGRSEDG